MRKICSGEEFNGRRRLDEVGQFKYSGSVITGQILQEGNKGKKFQGGGRIHAGAIATDKKIGIRDKKETT